MESKRKAKDDAKDKGSDEDFFFGNETANNSANDQYCRCDGVCFQTHSCDPFRIGISKCKTTGGFALLNRRLITVTPSGSNYFFPRAAAILPLLVFF